MYVFIFMIQDLYIYVYFTLSFNPLTVLEYLILFVRVHEKNFFETFLNLNNLLFL